MQNDNAFIQQQANDWVVKLETDTMKAGDEERFVAWLEQDEQNGIALQEAEITWKLMHQVAVNDVKPDKSNLSTRSPYIKTWASLAATLLIVSFSSFWWQGAYFSLVADHATSKGHRDTFTLEDGSVITLNTNSAIQTSFTESYRTINLLSGEIHVDVASDASRPFSVNAGELQVTALGTAFIVKKVDDFPAVTVTEHSVRVQSNNAASQKLVLEAGHKVFLNEERNRLSNIEVINTSQAQAWKQGKLVFKDESLGKVIGEIGRYYKGKVIFRDAGLNNLRISGVLNVDEPMTAFNELAVTAPIKVKEIASYIVVIEKR